MTDQIYWRIISTLHVIFLILFFLMLVLWPVYGMAASATVTWQQNETAANGPEEGFNVQRSLNGGTFSNIAVTGPDVMTYVDTTIVAPAAVTAPAPANKNTYCYQVVSWNKNPAKTGTVQNAPASNQGCVDYLGMVNPAPIAPPAAASGLTATLDTSTRKAPAPAQRKK